MTFSKNLSMFFVGLLTGAVLSTAGFSLLWSKRPASGSGEVQVLKLGHSLDTGHPVHLAMVHMRERLEALSGGRVTIDIYPGGVLGSEAQSIEQLQNGTLSMTKTSTASMENFIPEMALFGLPYLFEDAEHYWQVLEGDIGVELLAKAESRSLKGLCYYDSGSRNFYTVDTPIREPSDLNGLKIRTQESRTAMDMISTLGAAPTPINWGELYTALAQGTVDGAENNLPSFYTNKHYEICKHFSLDAHTRVPDVLLMSAVVFNKLDPQVQAWVLQAAGESSVYQRELWRVETGKALEAIQREGVTVYKVDIPSFMKAVQPMYDKIVDPVMLKWIERVRRVNQ